MDQRAYKVYLDRGARFTLDERDEPLVADVYKAELSNRKIVRQIEGLSRQIDLLLHPYRCGFSCSFKRLGAYKRLREVFNESWLSRYLKLEALGLLPAKTQRQFNPHLQATFKWDGEPVRQRVLSETALPGHKERVSGIALRVIRENRKRGYVVFEVFALNADLLRKTA